MELVLKSKELTFHDGGPYHVETSPLIYRGNQWNGLYMTGTSSVMKELKKILTYILQIHTPGSFFV